MASKKALLPMEQVIEAKDEYAPIKIGAPRVSGLGLKAFVWLIETPFLGNAILSYFMRRNRFPQVLQDVAIPNAPMFFPEYHDEFKDEIKVRQLDEESHPIARVTEALNCLPPLMSNVDTSPSFPFVFWTIRDYAKAYRSGRTTPSEVAELLIQYVGESQSMAPCMNFFSSFLTEDLREQAAASSKRFLSGNPLSILDGILIAVKDDIDCIPHPTKGGTQWLNDVREVTQDAVCISRLRDCGVIFAGKANMHELGVGTTGSNPLSGTARNPYNVKRYPGGSSSGSAAIVASGLCPVALGTDAGGSIRIPSALCGVVGLKSTFGRTTLAGLVPVSSTLESVGPIAASVEDAIVVYSAMVGSIPGDNSLLKPPAPNVPCLTDVTLQGLKFGKFSKWFSDASNLEIPHICEHVLDTLVKTHRTEVVEIVIPELEQLRTGHAVTAGSETCAFLDSIYSYGRKKTSYETRGTLAFFRQFKSSLYISAQRLRRRIMFYHMEILKEVDVIVTPTTAATAPPMPDDPHKTGQTDLATTGKLMQFVMQGNFIGLPCITIPVGYDSEGLPIGLQLIARPWQEATLFLVASAIEKLCTTTRRRPMVFYDMLASSHEAAH